MTVELGQFESDERDEYDSSDDSQEREYDDEEYEGDDDDYEDSDDDSDDDSPSLESLKAELEQYRNRFSGATRKINEVLREKDMSYQQWVQERNQLLMALMQERVKDLEPEEQRAKLAQFQTALDQQTQLQMQEQQSNQQQQVFGLIAKRMAAQHLANEYGVPEEELLRFNNADDMKYHAETLANAKGTKEQQSQKRNSQRRKSSRRQEPEEQPRQRRSRRQQQFDSPEPVARRGKAPQTVDDAEKELMRLVKNARRSTV